MSKMISDYRTDRPSAHPWLPSQHDIISHMADTTRTRPVPSHLTRDHVTAVSSVASGAGHERQQQLWPALRLLEQGYVNLGSEQSVTCLATCQQ